MLMLKPQSTHELQTHNPKDLGQANKQPWLQQRIVRFPHWEIQALSKSNRFTAVSLSLTGTTSEAQILIKPPLYPGHSECER